MDVLDGITRERRAPPSIRCDNGPEFAGRLLDQWAYFNGVELDFSRRGRPTDDAFIESSNASVRRELLNASWFLSLAGARERTEAWRGGYDEERPHSSLGDRAPQEFIEEAGAARETRVAPGSGSGAGPISTALTLQPGSVFGGQVTGSCWSWRPEAGDGRAGGESKHVDRRGPNAEEERAGTGSRAPREHQGINIHDSRRPGHLFARRLNVHEPSHTCSAPITSVRYPPSMNAEIIALGALCDLAPPTEVRASPGTYHILVHEFAVLADGRRLILRELGYSGGGGDDWDPWSLLTRESIERDIRNNVVAPDDDDFDDGHPYEWLCELLLRQGIATTEERLREVPYTVEFSQRLEQRLGKRFPS